MTGHFVKRLDELPACGAILLDVTPCQFLRLAGERLPRHCARALQRFRYGPAPFKVYLCSASIPPAGGVHGMARYHAAFAALRGELR